MKIPLLPPSLSGHLRLLFSTLCLFLPLPHVRRRTADFSLARASFFSPCCTYCTFEFRDIFVKSLVEIAVVELGEEKRPSPRSSNGSAMASESAAFAAAPPEAAAAEGDLPPPLASVDAAAKEPPRIRLLPRNSDDHRGDIAQFNKAAQVRQQQFRQLHNPVHIFSSQVSGYLTDLDLYSSDGGAPVSVHRSILCDLSPWLARLLVDRECCKCQGKVGKIIVVVGRTTKRCCRLSFRPASWAVPPPASPWPKWGSGDCRRRWS